jgi:hypothetical protein
MLTFSLFQEFQHVDDKDYAGRAEYHDTLLVL